MTRSLPSVQAEELVYKIRDSLPEAEAEAMIKKIDQLEHE